MDIYSVLIIGAGKIGAFFDTPDSERVLTHAHAFSSHPGFRLVGFMDSDRTQAERAAALWGGEAFSTLADAFALHEIDVAVVAAPDEFHYALLKELAGYPLRLVFAEKPLTKTVTEAEEIVDLYRERNIPLALNYSRRYVPEFAALRDEIASGRFGAFLTGTGYYGKGMLHNGSHMVDLLRFLLGDITEARTISCIYDHFDDDPSCSAVLNVAGGQFCMEAVDCRCYTVFELDLLFERARVRIIDAGFRIEKYMVRSSEVFSGYRNLDLAARLDTGLGRAINLAVESIYGHFESGSPLVCSSLDGVFGQRICSSILGTS